MHYVFNFGSFDQEDEKKYILNIISKLFSKKEQTLKERTKDAISKCHEYLRETFDPSIYLCYYIRLVEDKTRNNFDTSLYENLIKIVNYKPDKEVNLEEKGDLLDKIDEPLKSSITKEIVNNK